MSGLRGKVVIKKLFVGERRKKNKSRNTFSTFPLDNAILFTNSKKDIIQILQGISFGIEIVHKKGARYI